MPSMRVAVLVTLGLALSLTSGAMAASPEQNKALAKQHFEAGVSHFDLAEWEQALVEFKEAYRLKSDPSFLYNIAQGHRRLGHVDEALTFYKTYLRRAPDAPNREEVERRIQELEAEQQARKAEAGRQAKETPAVKAAAEEKPAAEAKPATLPGPRVEMPEQQPVPAPLPTPVAGPASPADVSPATENRADLVQPAGSTQPEATAETSILHRWWFWSAVGVVVAGGVTAALLATRGGGNGPFCSDCAATWGVDAK